MFDGWSFNWDRIVQNNHVRHGGCCWSGCGLWLLYAFLAIVVIGVGFEIAREGGIGPFPFLKVFDPLDPSTWNLMWAYWWRVNAWGPIFFTLGVMIVVALVASRYEVLADAFIAWPVAIVATWIIGASFGFQGLMVLLMLTGVAYAFGRLTMRSVGKWVFIVGTVLLIMFAFM